MMQRKKSSILNKIGQPNDWSKCLQAKTGREKELEVALQRLRGENTDISQELAEIKDYTEICQRLSEDRILDLFQWKYAHSLVVGVGLMLLQQLAGSVAIPSYADSIFESADFSSTFGTTATAIIQVSAAGMCLSCLIIGISFLLQDLHKWKELTPIMVLIGMVAYLAWYSLGFRGLPWVIISEIYPVNIKGSAGSLVTFILWSSSTIVVYVFNFIFEWNSAGDTFLYLSLMSLLTCIYIGLCSCVFLFIKTGIFIKPFQEHSSYSQSLVLQLFYSP
ncbi:sugar transporter ERD6-like 17 isoform X3 [Vitis vinifera]|uniref:sugar transporter ERD6-like 17 isoform X3 n=1 Tax=Vitis vinifera TaxID=29760 RepID=UPI0008FED58A|nr:sugar transporter ERD6-like 17 isoform X3 [Vitis vinifera]|eukprot:XP_019078808.1 PREDICTED: sugar transporter ERD6-like 17 isoform X3 [Vitis vinifera]